MAGNYNDDEVVASTMSFQSKIKGRRSSSARALPGSASQQRADSARHLFRLVAASVTHNAHDQSDASPTGITFSDYKRPGLDAQSGGSAADEPTGEVSEAERAQEQEAPGNDDSGQRIEDAVAEDVDGDPAEGNTNGAVQDARGETTADDMGVTAENPVEGEATSAVEVSMATAQNPPGSPTDDAVNSTASQPRASDSADQTKAAGPLLTAPDPHGLVPFTSNTDARTRRASSAFSALRWSVHAPGSSFSFGKAPSTNSAPSRRQISQIAQVPQTISQEVYTRAVEKAFDVQCLKHSKYVNNADMRTFVLDHLLVEQQLDNFSQAGKLVEEMAKRFGPKTDEEDF